MTRTMRKAIRATVSIVSTTVLLSTIAACGGNGGADAPADQTADAVAASSAQQRLDAALAPQTSIGLDTPLNGPPEKGKLAYLIRFNLEGTALLSSWPQVAAEAGWEGRLLDIDPADPQAGNNAIERAIAAGADYIAVSSNSLEAVQAGVDNAKANDVPVFFHIGVGEPEGERNGLYGNASSVETDVALSTGILDWAIADSEGKGSVLWVNYPDVPGLALGEPFIREEFQKNCPQCTFEDFDLSTEQVSSGATEDLIVAEVRKNPDIKYVATILASAGTGLRQALDSAGLEDVQIGVGAIAPSQFDAVGDGEIQLGGAYGAPESMYALLDQMLRFDQGMDVQQDAHALRPFQLYTKETIGEAKEWRGPEDFEAQYRKLWNVS